jgi:hypothetical protein
VSDQHAGAGTQVARGVGALAADALAEAAGLVAALARQSGQAAAAARAESIAARSSALSVSNELAFVRASRRLDSAARGQGDDAELRRTLASAADVPLQVCLAAGDLVVLAADLVSGPMPERDLDLRGVVQLAAGACACASLLVSGNTVLEPDDPRRVRAHEAETAARAAADRLGDRSAAAPS